MSGTITIAALIEETNRKGCALGRPDIKTDTIDFVYKDEKFNFPAFDVMEFCKPNGTFYTAPVKKLRELEKNHGRR